MGKAVVSTHDHVIRSKLLNRLGIYKNMDPPSSRPTHYHHHKPLRASMGGTRTSSPRSLIGNVVPFVEPLTGNHSKAARRRRRIQFHTDVAVLPIPSRHEYSNRIKKCLWSDASEIQENAERNRVEFAWEGWSWTTVLEDDEMYVDATTGELVHPVWFEEEDEEEESTSEKYLNMESPSLTRSESIPAGLVELNE